MSLHQIDSIEFRVKNLGYRVTQSRHAPNLWYASKLQFNYLFALIYEQNEWRVNDITGNGFYEKPRIEREVKQCLNR
jgi:hypothetical protein